MYGLHPRFRPRGGGPPSLVDPNYLPNPNFYPTNPNFINPFFPTQNPFFPTPNPGFPIPNPNFPPQQFPNPQRSNETLERIDRAVLKARRDILVEGQTASVWKVSEAALFILKADSWDSLGFRMQQVPSLNRLIITEGKINAIIHCFVGVRRITSLFDLEEAICDSEGVGQFEELELGPLIRHPLVMHYFSVSSDVTEVFKISSEEIISSLIEFMDTHRGKEVNVDELLDFIAMKRSVTGRDKLCVRIQSLGWHISHIWKARRSEGSVLKKCLEGVGRKFGKKSKKRPLFSSSQKKELDDHFSSISQRVKDFSGKHIKFTPSSEEDDSDNYDHEDNKDQNSTQGHSKFTSQNTNSSDRVSCCPYPSANEERSRLGLKNEIDASPSPASGSQLCDERSRPFKRMRNSINISTSPSHYKQPKGDEVEPDLSNNCKKGARRNFLLADESIRMFITTWKEACRENDAAVVLERMLQLYKPKKRQRVKNIFLSYPGLGLLNAAVTSIKRGMWDSMYDSFQTFSQIQEIANTTSEKGTDYVSIEVEPSETDTLVASEHVMKFQQGVTVDDVLSKVSTYFELGHDTLSTLEKNFIFLRKLYKCEFWLTEQFSVKEFESLGYGEFFMFLEKHVSLLPQALQKYLSVDNTSETKTSLEACMLQHQLSVLLSQASNSLRENETLNKQNIAEMLTRQFPSICFKLVESCPLKDFQNILRETQSNVISNCVLFSATLFGTVYVGPSSSHNEKGLELAESVTTKDAIEVLLRAPMLTNLDSWLHWDLIYAPSLGPLVAWLLNEVNAQDLLCLVTKGGKALRINHLATMDSFLEAFIQGSPFQTAVELLSLFALYGGERNVPLSLLKCHARKAFEVIVKNSMEMEINKAEFINKNRSEVNKEVPFASRFILDCLGQLPVEFRSFAADLLLSGVRPVINDAPSAILNECKQTDQRLMLHEIGLSLGIVEWINDYHSFRSSKATDLFLPSGSSCLEDERPEFITGTKNTRDASDKFPSSEGGMVVPIEADSEECEGVFGDRVDDNHVQRISELDTVGHPAIVIESIRCEEFGLDPSLSATESSMLKKQHARLGRALHCLSQELYSQDSHFLLELIQNADDNVYPVNVEPTLTFILLEEGIIVLNNEQGFSAQNIRALCDVGNSTKKGSSAGYIGKKGIGFKSVFRVSNAPEIHSNGFHIKFDITEGQIGFVLPTVVPPCDIQLFSRLASTNSDPTDNNCWNTCVVLPFRSKFSEGFALKNIISMFSDLHPSLLLFLHRLQCIKFRNMLNDSHTVMKKEVVGDGIVKVSLGKEKMTWLVVSQNLQADAIRPDVQKTEISIAFTLQELGNGNYIPHLEQQPVFAFLPLRTYGLKFILQGDFILPSSREEVDGDSPWNQWLLSEFPGLFVSSERSFCDLPCFRENPGKAVAAFMSFVPLVGEVHGFFSSLPRMITSKLRMSNCLLLEGDNCEWVPPCKVLRNWTEQARALLPDGLLREHLGLRFLNKDIVLSDSLARTLGIEEYGPKILLQIISSLCHTENGLKSMGSGWLSSWLNAIYVMSYTSQQTESDLVINLRKLPFIPLSDDKYGSVDEDTIWLHSDAFNSECGPEAFPKLYAKLRTVSPALFAGPGDIVENVTKMLCRVGVQQLSVHEIVKVHVLPAISDDRNAVGNKDLMIEYLCFIMFHLQSSCLSCSVERDHIIFELCNKALILTNHGYKRPADVSIHFSKEFGNPIDMNKLIIGMDVKWHEVDSTYLQHPITQSVSGGTLKWRKFFQELGITDFVRIVQIEKPVTDIFHVLKNMTWDRDMISSGSTAKDWESQELVHILSQLSSSGDQKKCKYLLEVLDTLWDDCCRDKVTGYCYNSSEENKPFKSSFISILQDVRWIASSMDDELHYPIDLFHNCEAVRSIMGVTAPYAVPKVRNEKLLNDLGFKTQVTIDDVLSVLGVWRRFEIPFKASISQMSKFYTFIWSEMSTSKQKITENLFAGAFIFVPHSFGSSCEDIVPGVFLTPQEVYWHDSTGSVDQMSTSYSSGGPNVTHPPFSKMLLNVYPTLHDFFVKECGVNKIPPFRSYLQILLQLSTVVLPSQAAKTVYQVFLKWCDELKSGLLGFEDVDYLKESLLRKEFTVLPTALDKWVSLHPSFGLVCWCDDETLRKEFKHLDNIDFLYFGELSDEEKVTLGPTVSALMQRLGIPSLSKVATREAIYYGPADSSFKTSLVNWALPFAQRYIYNVYPDKYFQLKQSGFETLCRLRIIVVEKLFYRNVIKRSNIASKKRYECSCLFQGYILYTTTESDSHSIFMELSRILVDGTPQLHLANFLHMITTMAESGSTEEQTEFFILNSQKIPNLPDEESVWTLQSPSSEDHEEIPALTMIDEHNLSKSKRKPGVNPNWPPADWKTAPGFGFARANGLRTQPGTSLQYKKDGDDETVVPQTDQATLIEINADWTIKDDPASSTPSVILQGTETFEDQSDCVSNIIASGADVVFDPVNLVLPSAAPHLGSSNSLERDQPGRREFGERDQLGGGTVISSQHAITGRLGELVASKYFASKVGETNVKWVNEGKESGLPYDIVVEDEENKREYIEVKATVSARKDWFLITVREWQFAVEKGELFSIARVVLLDNNTARVTVYKNPLRLCHLGQLQLAVVMPKQPKEFSSVS